MSTPEPAPERVAVRNLPTRCSRCGCRIDHGDRYRVIGWGGGFDYEHADCSKTAFIDDLKERHGR